MADLPGTDLQVADLIGLAGLKNLQVALLLQQVAGQQLVENLQLGGVAVGWPQSHKA